MPGEENADMYAMGTTRVYLKEEGFNKLQLKITSILDRVTTVVQNHMRRYLQQKWYKGMKRWAILHQRLARGKVKRRWFVTIVEESTFTPSHYDVPHSFTCCSDARTSTVETRLVLY